MPFPKGISCRYYIPSRKRLTVFEDHEAAVKVDDFSSTFFAFDEVEVSLVAQDVAESLADAREIGVHGGADEVGEVVDGFPEQLFVAVCRDVAVNVVKLFLVVVKVVQRQAVLMKQEEDVKGFAQRWHLYLGVVAVGKDDVAFSGNEKTADFVQSVVFQQDVKDDLVESHVVELFFGVCLGFQGQFFDEGFLFCAANGWIDFQDVGVQLDQSFQGLQGVVSRFDDEKVLVNARLHVSDFEEKGRLADF